MLRDVYTRKIQCDQRLGTIMCIYHYVITYITYKYIVHNAQHHITDCRNDCSLSESTWTFAWDCISCTWIRSYHALCSHNFRRSCDSRSRPNKCLFFSQEAPCRHPRRKLTGRLAHDQRQCVSRNAPGQSGRLPGPRALRQAECGAAYRTSMKVTVPRWVFSSVSHVVLSNVVPAKNRLTLRICIPQMIRARRLVTTPPRLVSVPSVNKQM